MYRVLPCVQILGTDYLQAVLRWVDSENLPEWLGGTSHGSLLDDVGPWSDPDTVSRLGLDLDQLRHGHKPLRALPAPVSRLPSLDRPPSLRYNSDTQSEAYQSPQGSAMDLSGFR